MKRILVLGAGRVGGFMAEDLAAEPDFEVTIADVDPESLDRFASAGSAQTVSRDLSDPAVVRDLARDHDLVVGALPGDLGYRALAAVIEAGTNCADISFFPEDALTLDEAARARGVTAVVDCGVAPGLAGIVAGYEAARLDRADRLRIDVGGLPVVRTWPFEYKAVFSPADVIEEYTRPARIKRAGRIETVPALSAVERVDLPEIGTLESFITDGLRTLLDLPFADMEERTLRYPGHADRMRMLRDTGFFDREPITVDGVSVSPLSLTSRLLFPRWRLAPDEAEFTVMRIEADGEQQGKRVRRTYDLLELTDTERSHTSMARATGLPNTVLARRLARGALERPGIVTPERIGADVSLAESVMAELAHRGIGLAVTESPL